MRKIDELVSVVIPVYNREETICDAVNSVLNQSYSNLEVILVDDASTDNIYDRMKELKDSRIRYFKNDKNMGGNFSRNRGILNSKGRYIAFQDSSDIWNIDKLEKQMAAFSKDQSIDIVYCETLFKDRNGKDLIVPNKDKSDDDRNKNIYDTLLQGNIIDTTALVIKKDCFNKVGMFDIEMPRLQEWELCIRLAKHYKFQCVDEVLSKGQYRTDSISANWRKLIKACALLIKKHKEEMKSKNVIVYNILNFYRQALLESDNQITASKLMKEFYENFDMEMLVEFGINEGVLKDLSKEYRFRKYYQILSKILNKISKKQDFKYDFTGKTITIYGFGTMGRIIYDELKKQNIKVEFIIDNGEKIKSETLIYKISEITNEQITDTIIVTPVYDYLAIKEQLTKLGYHEIISLEEMI